MPDRETHDCLLLDLFLLRWGHYCCWRICTYSIRVCVYAAINDAYRLKNVKFIVYANMKNATGNA